MTATVYSIILNVAIRTKVSNDKQYSNTNHLNDNREIRTKVWSGLVCYSNLNRSEEIIFILCPEIPTLHKENNIFLLCPDSYFAHEQFRNRTGQSRNSNFVRKSENSYFAQVQFRNCTDSYSAQNIYISQLIRFARVCNHVTDFNARNKCLTAKLLQQGYRYHKLRKTFSKFYRRHYELISKYNVGLKTLLSEGLSEPEFYGDLVYKLKKLKGINDFSLQFGKIISRYRRIGYNLNVMRQSACLVFNPIMVDNYAAFFNCTPVGRASDSMMAPT